MGGKPIDGWMWLWHEGLGTEKGNELCGNRLLLSTGGEKKGGERKRRKKRGSGRVDPARPLRGCRRMARTRYPYVCLGKGGERKEGEKGGGGTLA